MNLRLGVVMDPIAHIHFKKDTTLGLLLEAAARGYQLLYMELGDLFLQDGAARGVMRPLTVSDDPHDWFSLGEPREGLLSQELDVLLMRKDPPIDTEYLYSTYLLERAEADGCLVVNRPEALRRVSEKLYTAWFAHLCPPSLVSRDGKRLLDFAMAQGSAVVKPLGEMGGRSVFKLDPADPNARVILETATWNGNRFALVQRYLPEISHGDKRILVINGEPMPHCLARLAAPGEFRANLAAGGRGEVRELTERDWHIARQVGPVLRELGILFAGLDVIGEHLTEINVTSPTCMREIEAACDIGIAARFFEVIERRLQQHRRP
jgi:glutathione synthase